MAWRTASAVARHQSRGSCSAQPGRGLANGACSSFADARILPFSSTMIARVPPVPTSTPRVGISPPIFAPSELNIALKCGPELTIECP